MWVSRTSTVSPASGNADGSVSPATSSRGSIAGASYVVVRTSRRTPRVVVTAGPTREAIDDVRFLSNASTGRMGIEIARDLARRGASVVLVLGPTTESPPTGLETHRVTSTGGVAALAGAAR